jgi:molecular chaperone GrpE
VNDFSEKGGLMSPDTPATPVDTTPAPQATMPEAAASADLETLKADLEAMRAQAAENQDKYLRAKAETENVRRRAEAEVASTHKFAIERFALEMLAVKDSLERAKAVDVQAAGEVVLDRMLEGIDLTLRLMDSVFQKFALAEVSPAKGDRFDPEQHQAMSMQETSEVPANHVVVAVQKGYLLNGRLLRPALVIVAKAPESAPAAQA